MINPWLRETKDTKGTLDEKDTKKQKLIFLALGVIILGVMITLLPTQKPTPKTKQQDTPILKPVKEVSSYEGGLEKRLTEILQEMEGVGRVKVMLTTVSNEEKILAEEKTQNYEKQEEKDQGGGTRVAEKKNDQNKIVFQEGNIPFIVKENKPMVKGVLVLAEGADNGQVKSQIIEAVSALLDVPVHKVSVYKKGK